MSETVKEHCKHKDCVYRGVLSGTPTCDYIFREGHSRGCSISECNKYKTGFKKKVNSSEYGFTVEVCDDI